MNPWPWGRGARETTVVSTETEVHIPLRITWWMIVVGDGVIVGAKLIKGLNWLHKHLINGGTLWGRAGWLTLWWSEFRVHWPKHVIHMLLWTITVPPALLLIKYGLEMWDKHFPPADAKERAQYGPIGPFYGLRRWLAPILRGGFRSLYDQKFGAKHGNKYLDSGDRRPALPGDVESDLRHPPVSPGPEGR